MKKIIYQSCLAGLCLMLSACPSGKNKSPKKEKKKEQVKTYSYSVRMEAATELDAAPALQSFVHATHGDEWLLFAGRTNAEADEGGLHKQAQDANYSNQSFVPISFNTRLYSYNYASNKLYQMEFEALKSKLKSWGDSLNSSKSKLSTLLLNYHAQLQANGKIFRISNPQCTQVDSFLYVIGGYGPALDDVNSAKSYKTSAHFARIHVPTMLKVVESKWDELSLRQWKDLFRFGTNSTLKATGGEMFKLGEKFYLAGGHNYQHISPSQTYLNCVYKFDLTADDQTYTLSATNIDTISDKTPSQLKNDTALVDSTSKFRRRDGPIVPTLYTLNQATHEGISFYGGVFKYHFAAWNKAIHIQPGLGQEYIEVDSSDFYMNNYNVYSCPDFGILDKGSNVIHTFLPGGIGNGKDDNNLSAFTNTLGHATYNFKNSEMTFEAKPNCFSEEFFGAEAAFLPSSNSVYDSLNGKQTELIHGDKTFPVLDDEVMVGYIYGGIQAFEGSPSTYGPGKSAATNRIWRVLVKRTEK
ncbi:MAG: hypothetical protein RIC95_10445 [Vicingaceae bacterium]